MVFKFVQINIYAGKYLDNLVSFLKKEEADFITLQEVTSGGENRCEDKTINLFEHLKEHLNLNGVFNKDFDVEDRNGVMGNAVLSKYPILDSNPVILKPYRVVKHSEFVSPKFFPMFPRHMLDAKIDVNGQTIHVLSLHGAWTAPPQDTEETLKQAAIAANYLKDLSEPFLLAGDLNNIPQSKTIGTFNAVSNNFMNDSGVIQTTHPKIHKIVPRGYLVDYIFASSHFKLKSLVVPEVMVSDHLPVAAEIEL